MFLDKGIKLIDIDDLVKLAQVVDGQLLGENIAFETLIVDSRKARQNSVFIALHGEKFDGNIFCLEVLSKGCCAVITDDPEIPGRAIVVDDTYLALLKLAQYQLNKVKPRTLAITGSNGKTTVKEMIGSLIDHQNTVVTKDNENNEFGIAYTVLKIDKDTENLILECGARKAGDFDLIVKYLWFDVLVITNLNNSHIGTFGSEEIILKTKLKLLEALKTKGLLIEGVFNNLSKSFSKQDPGKNQINIYHAKEERELSLKYSWLFDVEINESNLHSYHISMTNKDAESESERLDYSLNLGIRHKRQVECGIMDVDLLNARPWAGGFVQGDSYLLTRFSSILQLMDITTTVAVGPGPIKYMQKLLQDPLSTKLPDIGKQYHL